jgi:hypothetical protein
MRRHKWLHGQSIPSISWVRFGNRTDSPSGPDAPCVRVATSTRGRTSGPPRPGPTGLTTRFGSFGAGQLGSFGDRFGSFGAGHLGSFGDRLGSFGALAQCFGTSRTPSSRVVAVSHCMDYLFGRKAGFVSGTAPVHRDGSRRVRPWRSQAPTIAPNRFAGAIARVVGSPEERAACFRRREARRRTGG